MGSDAFMHLPWRGKDESTLRTFSCKPHRQHHHHQHKRQPSTLRVTRAPTSMARSTRSSLWIHDIHCLPLPRGPPAREGRGGEGARGWAGVKQCRLVGSSRGRRVSSLLPRIVGAVGMSRQEASMQQRASAAVPTQRVDPAGVDASPHQEPLPPPPGLLRSAPLPAQGTPRHPPHHPPAKIWNTGSILASAPPWGAAGKRRSTAWVRRARPIPRTGAGSGGAEQRAHAVPNRTGTTG